MSDSENKGKRNWVTKEIVVGIAPVIAAYLFMAFYQAGYCSVFGIPFEFITLNFIDVILTNRLTLMVAVIAFLWIGLYYNFLPSASSPIFRGFITLILILSISLGVIFGRSDAQSRDEFLVANTQPERVVLKIYGHHMILADFNRDTHEVQRSFFIQDLAAQPGLTYKLESVGPLTVK